MDLLYETFLEESDNLELLFELLCGDDKKTFDHHENDAEIEKIINDDNDYTYYTSNLYDGLRNMHESFLFYKNESDNLHITIKTLKDHIMHLEFKLNSRNDTKSRFTIADDDGELFFSK